MASSPLHYSFAHTALPILALGNPAKLYRDLFASKGRDYLLEIWTGLGVRMGVEPPSNAIGLQYSTLSNECQVAVVSMPPPQESPEVHFMGIVFWTRKGLFRRQVTGVRYFTLELGAALLTSAPENHLCEWSGELPSPKHTNYGPVRQVKASTFVAAIRNVTATP